jgi:hypothetical protein
MAAIAALFSGPVMAQEAERGPCHMGECSWTKTLSTASVAKGKTGELIKMDVLGGSSREGSRNIEWNAAPHSVYLYCSKRLPAVMMGDGGKYQVNVLPLGSDLPSILESSAELYFRGCHNEHNIRIDMVQLARKYRYAVPDDAGNQIPAQLNSPQDILQY